jgi:hypothetical protein
MVDVYSVLSPMMTTQKKILPAGFNPSSFLSQSPDFLKPGLFFGLVTGTTFKSYWHELRDHQEYSKKIAMKTGTHTQVPVPMAGG